MSMNCCAPAPCTSVWGRCWQSRVERFFWRRCRPVLSQARVLTRLRERAQAAVAQAQQQTQAASLGKAGTTPAKAAERKPACHAADPPQTAAPAAGASATLVSAHAGRVVGLLILAALSVALPGLGLLVLAVGHHQRGAPWYSLGQRIALTCPCGRRCARPRHNPCLLSFGGRTAVAAGTETLAMNVDLKILDARLRENMPAYATPGSAGLDLRACIDAADAGARPVAADSHRHGHLPARTRATRRDPAPLWANHKHGIALGNPAG